MRIESVVAQMCQCNPGLREKVACLSRAFGGWERWFQLELAYYIGTQFWGKYDVKLEDGSVYPSTGYRADISIYSDRIPRTATFVELKCQSKNEDPGYFARQIVNDLNKMDKGKPDWDCQLLAFTQSPEDTYRVGSELRSQGYAPVIHKLQGLTVPDAFLSFFRSPFLS